jgi:DNA invertase Pin-like site-specific DNA recombinase
MPDFIAYYRVSTDRQGATGLGLEAQRAAVLRHIATGQLAAAEREQTISEFMLACFHAYMKTQSRVQ